MINHTKATQIVTNFIQAHYSDQQLADLLALAQDGKLSYDSCCCFVGMLTADHAYRGRITGGGEFGSHYLRAMALPGAVPAQDAFYYLGDQDEEVRANLIPLVEAEMARREGLRGGVGEDCLLASGEEVLVI